MDNSFNSFNYCRRLSVCLFLFKIGVLIMTVKELIELLQKENPNALVYTMDNTDDLAFAVTEISRNILVGKDDTVVIH